MSYLVNTVLVWSSKFDCPSTSDGGIHRVPQRSNNTNFLDWDYSPSGIDTPVAGATFDTGDISVFYTSQYYAQMVAPFDCRLSSISWAYDMTDPANDSTGVRITAVKGSFTDAIVRTTTGEFLTVLGFVTSSAMTGNPIPQVQKGRTTLTGDSGNVSAGDIIGVTISGVGTGAFGVLSGVITCAFETR